MKALLLFTTYSSFALAGACIALGCTGEIELSKGLVLALWSILIAVFGLIEAKDCQL